MQHLRDVELALQKCFVVVLESYQDHVLCLRVDTRVLLNELAQLRERNAQLVADVVENPDFVLKHRQGVFLPRRPGLGGRSA